MTETTGRVSKFGNSDADEKRPLFHTFEIIGATKEGELQNKAAVLRPRHSRRASRESADLQRLTDATASQTSSPQGVSKAAFSKAHPGVPRHHRSSSSGYENGAGERFVMDSPLNNHLIDPSSLHSKASQSRAASKVGSASPAWENKVSSHGSDTSSRSRPRGGNTLPRVEKPAVLPKFGSWDEKDPSSAEFTVIFQKARDEKKSGASSARISQMQNEVLSREEDLYPRQHPSRHKSSSRGWLSCFWPKAVDP